MCRKKCTLQKYDLENRLIEYAVSIVLFTKKLPSNKTCWHFSNQLLRCGTAPAAHYGEAQSAESRQDFIHKLKLALKELKESRVWLTIICRTETIKDSGDIKELLKETEQLIAIIYKSIKTAHKNLLKSN